MNGSIKKYFLIIIPLFLGACANIVTPSGGEKDVTPPKYNSLRNKEEERSPDDFYCYEKE